MNEAWVAILEIPLAVRVAIVMLVIWVIYALLSGLLMKFLVLVAMLFNWLWSLVYKVINSLVHIAHRNFGKAFIEVDQIVTDFFGGIYGFIDKIRKTIEKAGKSERPYVGTIFLIFTILTLWIALPAWLHVEEDKNLFTAPYRKYIETETKVLDMVFSGMELSRESLQEQE